MSDETSSAVNLCEESDVSSPWSPVPEMLLSEDNDDHVPPLAEASDSDEDTDTDDNGEVEFEFGEGGGYERKKRTSPEANGGLPNYKTGEYDKSYWRCESIAGGKHVKLLDLQHGAEWVVPYARVNKALRFLHQPTAAAILGPKDGSCRCKRSPACYQKGFSLIHVLAMRYAFFNCLDERAATKYLADLVRPHNNPTLDLGASSTSTGWEDAHGDDTDAPPRPKFKWIVNKEEVCSEYFAKLFGVSKDKLKGVRALLKGEGTVPPPRVRLERPRVKYAQCKVFWKDFFKNCQRPNKEIRLFPVNASYNVVYEDYFVPWFQKVYPEHSRNGDRPCLGWFMSARHDPDFKDVKNRAKHHHARCEDCANLQAQRLRAFLNEADREKYEREWQDHQNEKRLWREFEQDLVVQCKHNPADHHMLWFDDTEALGLPKWTKRPMKNLPTARFQLIPFLIADLARGKDYYVFTAKGRFRKGANRLCSTLLATIRAMKKTTADSRHARTLTLIADNFSENKNNTLFAFLIHLVMLGWYDEIHLYYGPPGHTHNGGDKQHQILNEILGNFTSVTLAHYFRRFCQAWRQEHTRPTPVLLDVQWDFDKFYNAFVDKIGGHTNTANDPVACRGFRIAREPGGIVTLKWKTKAESGKWRGADGGTESPGFVLLKGRPRGIPPVVPPMKNVMEKKYYKQLLGKKMTNCLEHEGEPEARAWLAKAAKHGVVPVHRRVQEPGVITPGELGSEVELKCGDATAITQVIEGTEDDAEEFWSLPAELEQVRVDRNRNLQALSEKHRRHPAIGFARVPKERRPTWEGSAAQAVAAEAAHDGDVDDQEDQISEGASDSSSCSDGDIIQNNNARRAAAAREQERARKRRRELPSNYEPEVEKTEAEHDIYAVFGQLPDSPKEVWFGIKLQCRLRNKAKLQYLGIMEDRPGLYRLLAEVALVNTEDIEHTFKKIKFDVTTTYALTKTGRRKKTGAETETTTKAPLDAAVLDDLERQLSKHDDQGLFGSD